MAQVDPAGQGSIICPSPPYIEFARFLVSPIPTPTITCRLSSPSISFHLSLSLFLFLFLSLPFSLSLKVVSLLLFYGGSTLPLL